LQRLGREGAAALACPPDYLAVPLLGAAGSALGASRALAVKRGHHPQAILYAAVIGPPESAKTPALELIMAPVHDVAERLHSTWEAAMAQYEQALEVYEVDRKEARKHGDLPPKKPERPILERVTVNDATAEALVPILKDNPRGVVLVRDELIGWVQAMNQYREGGKGADQQFWLSAWSGSPVTVDRKTTHAQGPLRVRHPYICVVGGLVPDKLPTLRGDKPRQRVEHDGFLDRLLLAYPPASPVTAENWQEVPETTLQALHDVLKRLRELAMVPVQDGEMIIGQRPFLVHLTVSGRQAWQQFTQAHADECNAADFPPHLIGPWAKLRGYAARLALLLHYLHWACDEVEGEDVDGDSMTRAARLVAYFKSHVRKVYAVMDADPRVAPARRLLRWLTQEHAQQFTRREAYRALRGICQTVEDIDPLLTLLEQHGYIRPLPAGNAMRPGRKASPTFEVHPLISGHNGHNGHNSAEDEPEDAAEVDSGHCVHCVQADTEDSGTGNPTGLAGSSGGRPAAALSTPIDPHHTPARHSVHSVHSVQSSTEQWFRQKSGSDSAVSSEFVIAGMIFHHSRVKSELLHK